MGWWQAMVKRVVSARRLAGQLRDKKQAQTNMKTRPTGFHTTDSATKWGAFIDGFNRLPRPVLTTAIVGFFVIGPLYPDAFLKIASAYEKLPNVFWALLSVVVGFYFTGRMQSKRHALRIHETLEAVLEKTGDDKSDDPAAPPMEADYQTALAKGAHKKPNNMIGQWQKKRSNR